MEDQNPRQHYRILFGLLLLAQVFNLPSLLFNLPALGRDLVLEVVLLDFPVLEFVTDQTASQRTDAPTYRCPSSRMADRGADDCAAAGAEHTAGERALLPRRERLPGTPALQQSNKCDRSN
jgi:hypothetical protein